LHFLSILFSQAVGVMKHLCRATGSTTLKLGGVWGGKRTKTGTGSKPRDVSRDAGSEPTLTHAPDGSPQHKNDLPAQLPVPCGWVR
jgi:hypothetical protein